MTDTATAPATNGARPSRLVLPIPDSERRVRAMRPLSEIEADLARPLDPTLLHTKPKAGQGMIYIQHHTVKRLLDNYAYGWHAHQTFHQTPQGRLICDLTLLVPTSDMGLIARPNVGSDADESDDQDVHPETGELIPIGYMWHNRDKKITKRPEQIDPATVAWATAFKRAAAFGYGLGLYLYYLPDEQRAKLEALIPQANKKSRG